MNADVSLVKIKSEADSNEITDITECSHDDKPSTGMFAVSDDIVCASFLETMYVLPLTCNFFVTFLSFPLFIYYQFHRHCHYLR